MIEIEISSLVSIREAVSAETKCFMDHQDSHEVIFVHSDETRAAVKRSGSEPLIARIISTMRRADPRAQRGDDGLRRLLRELRRCLRPFLALGILWGAWCGQSSCADTLTGVN